MTDETDRIMQYWRTHKICHEQSPPIAQVKKFLQHFVGEVVLRNNVVGLGEETALSVVEVLPEQKNESITILTFDDEE